MTLNEECGFIQWVPNTIPVRPVLNKYYIARRLGVWVMKPLSVIRRLLNVFSSQSPELIDTTNRIKAQASDVKAVELYEKEILAVYDHYFVFDVAFFYKLDRYKPVFHEWFIETFPEPTAWLASRLTYGRTAAVMSMVGFILGYLSYLL